MLTCTHKHTRLISLIHAHTYSLTYIHTHKLTLTHTQTHTNTHTYIYILEREIERERESFAEDVFGGAWIRSFCSLFDSFNQLYACIEHFFATHSIFRGFFLGFLGGGEVGIATHYVFLYLFPTSLFLKEI